MTSRPLSRVMLDDNDLAERLGCVPPTLRRWRKKFSKKAAGQLPRNAVEFLPSSSGRGR